MRPICFRMNIFAHQHWWFTTNIFFFIVVEGCIWSHCILHGHFFPVLNPKFDQMLVWCKFRRRTSQNIVTSNSFFVIWKLQTVLCVPISMHMGKEASGPPMAECINTEQTCCSWETEKCLAYSFCKCECCTACEQTRAKKGMCIKKTWTPNISVNIALHIW